jgi:hypothetical protein
MKKMSVMISLLVCALILVFAAEPCFSAAVKEDFAGYRYRKGPAVPGTEKTFACRYHVDGQTATWIVKVGHPLVDGLWYNWDTKVRREIVEWTKKDFPSIPCDPSEDPPAGYTRLTGVGIIFGPFTLTPTAADGGIWEGQWKQVINKDGSRFVTAEAKGIGGLLEGRTFHLSTRLPYPAAISPAIETCACCPAQSYSTFCFEGWILTPASAK